MRDHFLPRQIRGSGLSDGYYCRSNGLPSILVEGASTSSVLMKCEISIMEHAERSTSRIFISANPDLGLLSEGQTLHLLGLPNDLSSFVPSHLILLSKQRKQNIRDYLISKCSSKVRYHFDFLMIPAMRAWNILYTHTHLQYNAALRIIRNCTPRSHQI